MPPQLRHHRHLLALFVSVVIAFWDVAGNGRGLFFGDHIATFKPRWFALVHDSLGDFDVVYDWFIILHVMLLAAGVYFLALRLKATPVEALLCAFTASLGGPFLFTQNLVTPLLGLAWAPWVWLRFDIAVQSLTVRNVVALVLVAVFHHVNISLPLLLLDVVAIGFFAWESSSLQRSGLLGGVLLGMAVLCVEPVGLDSPSMVFMQLVEVLAPSALMPPDVPFLTIAALGDGTHHATTLYLGVTLTLGACAILHHRNSVYVRGLVLVVIIGVVMAMQSTTLFVTVAGAALVALLPLGLRTATTHPRTLAVVAGTQFLVVIGLLLAVDTPEFRAMAEQLLTPGSGHSSLADHGGPVALLAECVKARVAHAMVFSGALMFVAFLAWERPEWPALGGIVVVLVALDLATAAQWSIFGAPVLPNRLPDDVVKLMGDGPHTILEEGELTLPEATHTAGQTYFEERSTYVRQRGYHVFRDAQRVDHKDRAAWLTTPAKPPPDCDCTFVRIDDGSVQAFMRLP